MSRLSSASVKVAPDSRGVQRQRVVVQRGVQPFLRERGVSRPAEKQRPASLEKLVLLAVCVQVHQRLRSTPGYGPHSHVRLRASLSLTRQVTGLTHARRTSRTDPKNKRGIILRASRSLDGRMSQVKPLIRWTFLSRTREAREQID